MKQDKIKYRHKAQQKGQQRQEKKILKKNVDIKIQTLKIQ